MDIHFTPVRDNNRTLASLVVNDAADTITLNGEVHDFSTLLEGEEIHAEALVSPVADMFARVITRTSGHIVATIVVPHGRGAPIGVRFPVSSLGVDGTVPLPA